MTWKKTLLSAGIASSVFFVDYWGKVIGEFWFMEHRDGFHSFFDGAIRTTFHRNYGLIANFPVPQPVIIVITTLLIVALVIFWAKRRLHASYAAYAALGLLLGGALGNLFNRIAFGYVFDWILLFERSVINVADIAITLGIILLLLEGEFYGKKPPA